MCDNNWIHLASLEENVQATIRLVVNTDGIPVFKLSKWTLWPLLASIHNFPYSLQITNILFFGFWSSFKKPNVQLFLSCFVDFLLTYPLLVYSYLIMFVFFFMYLFFCVIQLQELWFFVVGSLMIIMVAIGVLLKGRHCTVVNNLLSAISVPSNIRQTR
nr:uncharacterized protein LOC124810258 [Hydra vulgaris]XP_047134807.1 uncharacterized protein LOC124812339 [Hydra vulgaris]XP_047143849.1 uncharacterized protein LOC124817605 [Hydra vulgaris]